MLNEPWLPPEQQEINPAAPEHYSSSSYAQYIHPSAVPPPESAGRQTPLGPPGSAVYPLLYQPCAIPMPPPWSEVPMQPGSRWFPAPLPGMVILPPLVPPQPGQVIVGWEVFKPRPGVFQCVGLSLNGWLAVIILLILFWPLAWVPCVLDECYTDVQRPMYGWPPSGPSYSPVPSPVPMGVPVSPAGQGAPAFSPLPPPQTPPAEEPPYPQAVLPPHNASRKS